MTDKKPEYKFADVGPWLDGTTKWFNGGFGFVSVSGMEGDLLLHKTALPKGSDGRRIEPQNEREIKVRIGRRFKDGVDVGMAVAEAQILVPHVRERKAA